MRNRVEKLGLEICSRNRVENRNRVEKPDRFLAFRVQGVGYSLAVLEMIIPPFVGAICHLTFSQDFKRLSYLDFFQISELEGKFRGCALSNLKK